MREKIKTLIELCLQFGVPFLVDGEYFSLDGEAGCLAISQLGYDNIFYNKGLKRDLEKVDELIEFVENSDFVELPAYEYNINWEALWKGELHYVFFNSYGEIDEYKGLI